MIISATVLLAAIAYQSQSQMPPPDEVLGRPPTSARNFDRSTRTTTGSGGTSTRQSMPSFPNVQVSTPSPWNQNEVVMRVNPLDRDHLIGGANDNRLGGNYTCAFYSSMDGGRSWNELIYQFTEFGSAGDPAAAVGPNGEIYFCALEFGFSSAAYVGQSFDGGLTVPNWVRAVGSSGAFEDKEFLVADASPTSPLSGALYLSWTRFAGGNPIMMISSFDQGNTWSAPRRVSDSNNCQGSTPCVGPNGEIYIGFLNYSGNIMQVDRSFDGGLTWGNDRTLGTSNCTLRNAPFRHFCFPSLDADTSGGPYHGNVYAVYTTFMSAQNSTDVVLHVSQDQGNSWSSAIRVSGDTNNTSQFFPWVDVDANGNVNVGYYDRSKDANDDATGFGVARSSDGGQTWSHHFVSDRVFDPSTYSDGFFIGDYTGIAASDRTVHPLWTDGRNGTNDVFTTRVQLDFYGDTRFVSAATGGQVNFTINPGPVYQGADYSVYGSISGTTPGLTFPGGVNLPLNWDSLFLITIQLANTSVFQNFRGTLDATGSATAVLDSQGPVSPAFIGTRMDYAALVSVGGSAVWASNFAPVVLAP